MNIRIFCCDRPTTAMIAATLTMIFSIGGVAVGLHSMGPAFAAHEAGRTVNGAPPIAEVATARDPLRARIERFSAAQAKQFYLGCSSAALRGQLDGHEIAMCSIGYDFLLNRHFGGDIHALLAWSRSQPQDRDDAVLVGAD